MFSTVEGTTSGTTLATGNESKTCTALVDEVFRSRQAGPVSQESAVGVAQLLPRLLDRVNFSMWSQTSSKNLNSDIKALQGQRAAAVQLLDEIEKEAEQIEKRLHAKTQEAKLERNSKGFLGLPGLACTTCAPMVDSDEINLQNGAPVIIDVLELRPVLRSRLQEHEQTLAERDSELRQLKHDLHILQCEKEAVRQDEKDNLLDGSSNAKQQLLQRYGAAFSFVDGSQLKVAFLAWRQHAHKRALRTKMLKQACLALAFGPAQCKGLAFASWQALVHEKQRSQKLVHDKKRRAIAQSYAAKFVMQTDSTAMRAVVIEWWRVSKESAMQAHISAVHAKKEELVADPATSKLLAANQGQAKAGAVGKACCTLM